MGKLKNKIVEKFKHRITPPEKIISNILQKEKEQLDLIFDQKKLCFSGIELSTYCNLNCLMCDTKSATREKGEISWETFNKAVEELNKKGMKFTTLHTINEPLLDRRIVPMLELLAKHGISIILSTNGMLVDRFLEEIKDKNLTNYELRFSIDGATKETYEKIRQGASYDKLIDNLEKTLAFKKKYFKDLKLSVNYAASIDNIDEIPLFIKKFKKYFGKNFEFGLLNSLVPKDDTAYYNKVTSDVKDFYTKPCSMVFNSLYILQNGDVSPCCRDYNGDIIVGNIYENNLDEIWDNDKMNAMRETHLSGDITALPKQCQHCKSPNYFLSRVVNYIPQMALNGKYKIDEIPKLINAAIQKYAQSDCGYLEIRES